MFQNPNALKSPILRNPLPRVLHALSSAALSHQCQVATAPLHSWEPSSAPRYRASPCRFIFYLSHSLYIKKGYNAFSVCYYSYLGCPGHFSLSLFWEQSHFFQLYSIPPLLCLHLGSLTSIFNMTMWVVSNFSNIIFKQDLESNLDFHQAALVRESGEWGKHPIFNPHHLTRNSDQGQDSVIWWWN